MRANLTRALVGILVLASAGTWAGASPLVRGAQLLSQGRPQAALTEFQAAVAEDGTSAEAHAGVGAANLHLGDTTAALEAFNRAIELDSTCRPARLGIATAFFRDGEFDQALPQYRYCLAFDCVERPAVRAAAACTACLMGLYEAAEAEAALALREEPTCELARVVAGAAWIARGDPTRGAELLEAEAASAEGPRLTPRFALVAPSPLFTPSSHYYTQNNLGDENRLAFLGDEAVTGTPAFKAEPDEEPPLAPITLPEVEEEGFHIARPRPGTAVTGPTSVVIEVPPDMVLGYVALLVDDRFQTMTNAQPFRMQFEASRFGAGQHLVRVDAYGPYGDKVASATSLVVVEGGRERTLSYEEELARRAVSAQLERLLVVRASPGVRWQLLGHALQMTGRLDEAVSAYEEAFCLQPTTTGIRADLLTAYQDQGINVGTTAHEIHFSPDRDVVSLTFDDGPHPLITPRVLDLLDRADVKATFFLVGKQVELYPGLAREIVERGHEVGSHSYSHSNLRQFPKVYVERELVKSRNAIRKATGKTVTLFRPPGGNYDADVRQACAETGYTAVFWTSNIGECAGWTPEKTVDKFMAELTEGGMILLHNGEDGSLEVLPTLLARLAHERRLVGTVGSLVDSPRADGTREGQ